MECRGFAGGRVALAGLALLICLPSRAQAETPRVALRPISGNEIDSEQREALTEAVAAALLRRGGVEVLEPGQLKALVDRAAIDQALGCDTAACAEQLLSAVEIDGLIHGRLGALDGRSSLTLSIIDGETREVLARAQGFLSEEPSAIKGQLDRMAETLLAAFLKEPSPSPGAVTPMTGKMRIALTGLAARGVDEALARVLSDVLVIEFEKLQSVSVASPDDLAALVDRAALEQLLGCEDDCDVDLLGAAEADTILVGSVGKVGEQYQLSLSLLDRSTGRARARDRQQLTGSHERLVAAIESSVFNLVSEARGQSLGKPLAVGSLEALRTAQRTKPARISVAVGPALYVPLSREPQIQAPSFNVRLAFEYALAEVVLVGLALELDSLSSTSSKLSFLGDLDSGQAAYNRLESELALNSYRASALVGWRRAYGLVLPHVGLGLGLGYFDLKLGDERFVPVELRDTLPIAGLSNVREDDAGIGAIVELGAGVEFLFTRSLGLLLDVRVFRVFHSLEVRTQMSGMAEERPLVEPFQPLQGVALRVGLIWEI